MDVVRKEIGVDKIHQGLDLPQAYTGKGVVTGIVDGGIDPNHIKQTAISDNVIRFISFFYLLLLYRSSLTSNVIKLFMRLNRCKDTIQKGFVQITDKYY